MKNLSIKKILIIYTLIVFLFPIFIIGTGFIIITTSYLKTQIKKNSDSFLEVIEKDLKFFIAKSEEELFFIASLYKKSQLNNFLKFYIEQHLISEGYFETIFILNKNGIITNVYPSTLDNLIGFDYSNESIIKNTIDRHKITINLIKYSFLNEKPSLLITIPIFDTHDKLIAVVCGIIEFSNLRDIFLKLKECCPQMEFILLNEAGTVLIHFEKQKMEQIETLDYLTKLKENVINFVRIDNKFYFVKYKFIKKTEWILLVLQDYYFIILIFYKIFILFLINIITGVIFAILSVILGTYLISKPIYSLSYKTSQVSHTTNYNIEKENYFITELNSLSINLTKMIKRIADREKELKLSQSKYRKLIENSLDFFFKVNKEINFTFVSPSIESLLGYSSEEFKNNFRNIVIKNRMNITSRTKIKDVFKTKIIPEPFNLELKHKNGYNVILEIQVTPIIENGIVVEVQGIARDITLRFKAESEVIYLKNYLLNIIESLPSSLITLDTNGRITNLNSNAVNLINKPRDEIMNKILWEIDKRFIKYYSYFKHVLEKNRAIDFREEIIDNEGKEKFFNITFFTVTWENSTIIGLRIDDVTEIEKTQRQLQDIQKLETIGTIASGLSHDFNNILGAILGALRVIEERTKDKKSINCALLNDDLDVIKEASKKATHIVQQLMNFSRRQSIKFETIDINSEINNVINIFKKFVSNKNIKTIFKENSKNNFIEGNVTLIEQMLLNILLNARDAILENGTITIIVKKLSSDEIKDIVKDSNIKEFIHISISDTGKGIPDSIKSNIFTPLFTTKEKGKGTGLGLAMVYNIIKNHKGHITFDSKVNQGTTFHIYLPSSKDIKRDNYNKNKETYEIKNENIHGVLVIDDDLYIRYTTEEMLKELGYKPFTASKGEEAIEILKKNNLDIKVIILDVIMPGLSGKELVREILNFNKDYKILLMSGTRNEITIFELENMGIKDFLLKPFTFEELGEAIYKLMNKI